MCRMSLNFEVAPPSDGVRYCRCMALNVAGMVFQTFTITVTNGEYVLSHLCSCAYITCHQNVSVLLALRVYAIYAQCRSVLVIAVVLMFPRLFLDIWVRLDRCIKPVHCCALKVDGLCSNTSIGYTNHL